MDFNKLTAFLDSLNKKYGIPATDCKITRGHELVYRHMTGYSDYENKTPVTDSSLYMLFSATKLITMTAVMQQIERGNLGLYDELPKYLPEFGSIKVADDWNFEFPIHWPSSKEPQHYAHNSIRIIDLMSMTSGLSYHTGSDELIALKEKTKNQASTREVMKALAKMPLAYEPRTRYCYSLSHDVLAAVVEVVSGQKFSDYLKENIFAPLGINDFYFHWQNNEELTHRMCAMYMGEFGTDAIKKDDGVISGSFKITENYESGGAGLAGTADAYSLFIDALSNGGTGANGKRILSGESVQMFTVPYTTGKMSEDFAVAGKIGYEYGLGVRVLVDGKAAKSPVGEFGWDGAAGAYALVDTTNKISIFYTQHIIGFPKVYSEIHPRLRDIAYECMGY